ncbi:hypothetical protein FACS189491_03480 [Spirochaetia bacterium]|nr:hypothetical protein FACS189491_03480 [Spirochaetia bacterium]
MKKPFKGGISAMFVVLLVASLLVMGCSRMDGGSADAKAAASLLKSLGDGDTAAMEKALATLSPAVLAELTGNSGSPGGDFSYDLNEAGDGIIIKKYSGSGGVVVIPSTIEDFPVVSIASSSFEGSYYDDSNSIYNSLLASEFALLGGIDANASGDGQGDNITSVIIPAGVKRIGARAFQGCENLTTVILPDTLESIGGGAFNGCSNLYNFSIPDSITTINWVGSNSLFPTPSEFGGCGKLKLATRKRLQDLGYEGKF